jgi:hypothetical protein
MKNLNVVVDLLVVEQVMKCSEFQDWNRTPHFDPEFITGLKHFGQDDIVQVSDCFIPYVSTFCLWKI